MRKIESYRNEQDVRERLTQLENEGINLSDVTVVSNTELYDNEFQNSGVNYKTAEGSGWDKFVSFFSGDDSDHNAIQSLDLTAEEEEKYKRELEKGHILVYIDGDIESDYRDGNVSGFAGTTHDYNDREDAVDMTDHNRDRDGLNRDLNEDRDLDRNLDRDVDGVRGERHHDEEKIDLREERLNVDKEKVQTGEVHVDKHVETERQDLDVPVEREEVTVERRKVDGERSADSFDENPEDGSIRIPITEERVNVTKDNVVKEEIVINKDTVQDHERVSEEVRREEVDIHEDNNRVNDRDVDGLDRDLDRNLDRDLDRDLDEDGLTDEDRRHNDRMK